MRFSRVVLAFVLAGLTLGWGGWGCRSEKPSIGKISDAKPGFEPKAPHGGVLVEAGEDFAHVEIVFDPATGTLSAYILDGEAEEVVPLKQPSISVRFTRPALRLKLKAVASPLSGEKPGETSEYSVTDASLKGLFQFVGMLESVDFNGPVFKNLPFQYPPKKE
jgi:hypothetical protein